ncbi:DNA end-binding protein Ku [Chitinophaga terrae (ex Kim and Jung 2007)]|jgi:DNA end-binding protein Ku|uniref:Non-homologous end joining protein Ku n=1 Tax=Chitinophaga terrae (ex Kim and Jung 2007) TaxID=408074 RepID=A0A1H3XRZ9_9BACT|nr:Ku protein [Chitinophaga terrae (ex Kim and Jung 2007)]MDQ0105680.1 DNA end-binding protein Ku [Chitinophaga terrae (ex Kim and Jung 2007)]GEP89354.1 non-homologous end joining protein Ku [Chitinophaga terrae (ex Kim and Jung 2007)]SEA02146.1 DNA end-binding protein Ku [Chitinophaga terrae (ex Kim and Jung 2007)]
MRAIWSGSIGFGLVNIPVKLYSATQDSRLDLDMLDSKNGAHIKFLRVNENTGKEVPWEQIKKGYLYNDEYVMLDDSDFEAASPKRSKIIEIESFVEEVEIDDIYFETPYFIEPAKGGEKAYELLFQTLKKTGKAGLSRFVLRSQEHLAVVRPRENYLLLQQLRFEEEVRSAEDLNLPKNIRLQKKELDMAIELVKQYTTEFDISAYKDDYKAELMKIIKAKASGKKPTVKKLEVVHTKSDNLFDQLKASLNKPASKKRAS